MFLAILIANDSLRRYWYQSKVSTPAYRDNTVEELAR